MKNKFYLMIFCSGYYCYFNSYVQYDVEIRKRDKKQNV